jgi:hypothetical protein
MEEQLLHFIWHRKLFDHSNLVTTTNESIQIQHPGSANDHQGPDFLQSRILIGHQLWAGHVEIHVRSSAWYLHMHDQDAHYNNVILHVVWTEDQPVYTLDGYLIPCLELEGRVDKAMLKRFRNLMRNEEWVPCASSLHEVSALVRSSWLERLMAERLEDKTIAIHQIRNQYKGDWEQTFYVLLARQLAAPVNSHAMEALCKTVPLSLLRRHNNRIDQIEALLFGAAGLIDKDINDSYVRQLKSEFSFLRKKYGLTPMEALRWKFLRMRPAHFPTIRIAQLAKIISTTEHFVAGIESHYSGADWANLFSVIPAHSFWDSHYHFTSSSPTIAKQLGKPTAISLVINVVTPLMFLYGKLQGNARLKEKALSMLEEMPAEKNAIISGWRKLDWKAADAGQTQAMLQLKKSYCDPRRCLHCAIGLQVIR